VVAWTICFLSITLKNEWFKESENVYVIDVEYDLVFQKSFGEIVKEISQDPVGSQCGVFGSKIIMMCIQSNFGQFQLVK
jgi:hypothetical protein